MCSARHWDMNVSFWVIDWDDGEDSRQVLTLRAEKPGGQGGGHDDDEADDETPTVRRVSIFEWWM